MRSERARCILYYARYRRFSVCRRNVLKDRHSTTPLYFYIVAAGYSSIGCEFFEQRLLGFALGNVVRSILSVTKRLAGTDLTRRCQRFIELHSYRCNGTYRIYRYEKSRKNAWTKKDTFVRNAHRTDAISVPICLRMGGCNVIPFIDGYASQNDHRVQESSRRGRLNSTGGVRHDIWITKCLLVGVTWNHGNFTPGRGQRREKIKVTAVVDGDADRPKEGWVKEESWFGALWRPVRWSTTRRSDQIIRVPCIIISWKGC